MRENGCLQTPKKKEKKLVTVSLLTLVDCQAHAPKDNYLGTRVV